MLILNINGPINAGKSTVSKILVNLFPHATFIEVDDLLSDEEQSKLALSIQDGWKERCRRLSEKLLYLKETKEYETVIFAYPITEKLFQQWRAFEDENTKFLNVTIAPSLDNCLKNRGTRTLTVWELNRIHKMYEEGYHNRPFVDFIINNDNQTPIETAQIIKSFIEQAMSLKQQSLHLVERRWQALVTGEKTSTFRLNEGFVHKGFLVYKDCPNEKFAEVVYVTNVYYMPLKQALELDGFDDHTPDVETGLKQMQCHYPDITLDTSVLFAKHLSVPETRAKYPEKVKEILKQISKL